MEEQDLFVNRTDLSALQEAADSIRQQVAKVIVGQQEMVDLLLAALLADGHVLIEGVPGLAKTLTAKVLSKCIKADFSRIQFTPDLMPADVLGTNIFNPQTAEFKFNPGPVFGNIILIDEINRSPAKTQAALFEAMEERQVTVDGKTYRMEPPFMVLATQNPIEQEGTYRLPEAQLDRFLFKINVRYPSSEEENTILMRAHERREEHPETIIKPVIDTNIIRELKIMIREIHVEEKLIDFIVQLVQLTRRHKWIYLGASPRASLAILAGAKAVAAINGRDFVTPDDIIFIALPALRHRILLSPEKEMEGASADTVIQDIINTLEIPR